MSHELTAVPHHDGSATYVSDLSPDIGETVSVFLRVPRTSAVRRALLRTVIDGEQALTETVVDRVTDHDVWVRGQVRVENPVVSYRWLDPGPFTPMPSFGATGMVAAMRAFAAARPWRATAHRLTLVGSHDVPRIATLLDGDEGLITVAFGLLASMPGIPMLWAGDEIGEQGVNGEDGRRPFPWNDTGRWDMARLATNRALFTARAESVALRHGGLRWLAVSDDAITFLREAPGESVLVHAARADHRPVRLPGAVVGPELTGLAGAHDLRTDADGAVTLPAHGPGFWMWRC